MNIINHHFYLDSRDRQTGQSDTVFSVNNPDFRYANSYQVKSILVPHTFYNVNSHNNTFTIQKNGDIDRSITISPGNYTIDELLSVMKTALDALTGSETYTLTIQPYTSKVSIIQSSSTFIIRGSSTLNELLGFSTSDTADQVSHVASNVYDLSYTNYIKIRSNALTNFESTIKNSANTNGGLLFEIPIYNSFFGESVFHNFTDVHFDYSDYQKRDIDIEVLDSKNRPLGGDSGLNNRNIHIHLLFHDKRSNDSRKSHRRDPNTFSSGYGNIIN